jgi:O-antigen ligase
MPRGMAGGREAQVWSLVLLVATAALLFGTVHPPARLVVAGLVVGVVGMRTMAPSNATLPRSTWITGLAATVLGLLGLVWLVPISPHLRELVQPAFAAPMNQAQQLLGLSSLSASVEPARTTAAVGTVLTAVAVAWTAASIVRTRTRRLRLVAGLLAVSALVAVLGLGHAALRATEIYGFSGIPTGPARSAFFAPFVNPNHGGLFCVLGIPLAMGIGSRRDPAQTAALGVAMMLCIAGAVVSGSRGVWVALVCAILVFGAATGPRWVAGTFGALAMAACSLVVGTVVAGAGRWEALLAWFPQGDGQRVDSGRLDVWRDALAVVSGAPWLGVGPGGFGAAWRVVETSPRFTDAVHAHNDVLQAMAEHGLPVGLGWVVLWITPVALTIRHVRSLPRGRRRRLQAGLLSTYTALSTASLLSFPVHIGALALMAAVVGGAMVGGVGQDRRGVSLLVDRVARGMQLGVAALGVGLLAGPVVWSPVSDEPADSLVLLDQQLADRPLWLRGWLRRADLHVASADATAALADLHVAALVWPTVPWPHVARARLLRRLDDPTGARAAWKEALGYNFPDNDQARPWLREAIEGEPDPVAALMMVVPDRADRLRDAGFEAKDRGDGLVATLFFERARELDPTLGLPLVRQLLDDGLPRQARSTFESLPDDTRSTCRGRQAETDIALALDEASVALAAARAAIRRCSEADEGAWLNLVRARLATGDASAIAPMEELVAKYPERFGLRRALVDALRATHDHPAMVPHIEALIAVGRASDQDRDDLERIRKGLPPTPR